LIRAFLWSRLLVRQPAGDELVDELLNRSSGERLDVLRSYGCQRDARFGRPSL
jgi:hypothetical protein